MTDMTDASPTEPSPTEPASKPLGLRAEALGAMTFPPLPWLVEGLIPRGLALLAGKPGVGKSWLALDVAVAASRGGKALASLQCEEGDVLYLALGMSPRRLHGRMTRLLGEAPWPGRLTFHTRWPPPDGGGITAIAEWASSQASARLVVVDSLAAAHERADPWILAELRDLASRSNLAILVIHHVRKLGWQDPLDQVNAAIPAAGFVDTLLVLSRSRHGTSLHACGRDIETMETALTFDTESCRWRPLGPAAAAGLSAERSRIIDALDEAASPMFVSELVAATGFTRNNLDQLLYKMARDGEVGRVGRGRYYLTEAGRDTLDKTDKTDKKIRNGKPGPESAWRERDEARPAADAGTA